MIFARAGMGYMGMWDPGGVQIEVDHLRRRAGELHGELVVTAATTPVGHGQIHRAAFNISSTTMRDRLAKVLDTRTPSAGIKWAHLLEEFCGEVLLAEREGSPILVVGKLPPQVTEGYLIEAFLPENKASIIYAAGGTGKSYLGVLAAVCVRTGTPMLNWKVKQGGVLYLDWETDEYELDERVKRVANGLGLAVPEIMYRACAATLESMAEQLSQTVNAHGIRLVIVDSVGMATRGTGDGPAEETAIDLFRAMRYLGTTVLAIDHVTGADAHREGAIDKPYGSIYKVNLARSVWELKGSVPETGNAHLALFHRKVNKGRLQGPVGMMVTHTEDAVTFHREEVTDEGLVRGMTIGARITNALRRGRMSVPDLAEELGVSDAVVRVTLSRGRGSMFGKLPDGTWGLLAHEPE